MNCKNASSVEFTILSPGGPTLAYHVGCIIQNSFYVHGGINQPRSRIPVNDLHEYSFSTGIWSTLTSSDSPALSYHACVALSDRYLALIGGWNGKLRASDVSVFDTGTKKWMNCSTSGFPVGSGLSSHSANLLSDGTILVIGREGFLRTQRRYSSMFLISCKLPECRFKYTQLETTIESRSGHTCNMIGSQLFIIGGRSDHVLETHPFSVSGSSNSAAKTTFTENNRLVNSESKTKKIIPRKYHSSVLCNSGNAIFLHGGWTFDGKHKFPTSDCFLLSCTPTGVCRWTHLGDPRVHLSGHVMCADENRLIVHGGESGTVKCCLYEISATS